MHSIILGITGTGKTTLAKRLSNQSQRQVVVLEPFTTGGWNSNAYFAQDADEVLAIAQSNKNLDIFIDESAETLCRDNAFQFLATRSRQYGHRVFFIAQRASQILPVIRNNCETVYCFRQSKKDAEIIANDLADDCFLQCAKLSKGECIAKIGCDGKPQKYKIFSPQKVKRKK